MGCHKWLHAADAIVVKRSAMVRETQAWAAAEMEVEAAEEVMARERRRSRTRRSSRGSPTSSSWRTTSN